MLKKYILPIASAALVSACSGGGGDSIEASSLRSLNATSYDWAGDTGGVFNIPPVEFNRDFYGWGSFGFNTSSGIRYNKVDLHTGSNDDVENTMYIKNDDNALLYDSHGNILAKAWESAIGYNHVENVRDGGIIAGAINKIKVDGVNQTMVYAWSVNSNLGRHSGWMKISDLVPRIDIENILNESKKKRDAILVASGAYGLGLYEENKIVEAYLPNGLYDYYVTAGRDDDNGAGRARYYYTNVDNQYLSGLLNIPETGKQRFGVAHNALALNEKFYLASYVNPHNVDLFPPSNSGSSATNTKLTLAWGYSYTNTGEKIYSWINKAALSPTGKTIVVEVVVRLKWFTLPNVTVRALLWMEKPGQETIRISIYGQQIKTTPTSNGLNSIEVTVTTLIKKWTRTIASTAAADLRPTAIMSTCIHVSLIQKISNGKK